MKQFSTLNIVIYAIVFIAAVLCLLPIINIIAISLSEASIAVTGQVFFIPKRFTLASYEKMFAEGQFMRSFMISVARVVITLCLSIPVTVMMAYALSKDVKVFRERTVITWLTIIPMLFGGGLIPTYMVMNMYGLINHFSALILPAIFNTFNMLIVMNYFRGIPKELEESAVIDGAGPWRILWSIFLPLALPTIATVSLFIIVGTWNEFFAGLIYIKDIKNYPLQTYIRSLTINLDFVMLTKEELIERMKINGLTFNSAKVVVAMLPVLCIYPFLQKYFVKGLVLGSVKE